MTRSTALLVLVAAACGAEEAGRAADVGVVEAAAGAAGSGQDAPGGQGGSQPDAGVGGAQAGGQGGAAGQDAGVPEVGPEPEPEAGQDAPAEVSQGDGSEPEPEAGQDAGQDAGEEAQAPAYCTPPAAQGYNCSAECPTPKGYVDPPTLDPKTWKPSRCVPDPWDGCSNAVALGTAVPGDQAVVLPGTCQMTYRVEVWEGTCARLSWSNASWSVGWKPGGLGTRETLSAGPGCLVVRYARWNATDPQVGTVIAAGSGAGWLRAESTAGAGCSLKC